MKPNYGLEKGAVEALSKTLYTILASTHVLYVKTLNYHWNVEDPAFLMYHELFEAQYKALAESIDEIAERIRMMGEPVRGTLAGFLEASTVNEAQAGLDAKAMVDDLAHDHEQAITALRKAIEECESHGDTGTADFLTGLLRDHEKTAWFLRSHLA